MRTVGNLRLLPLVKWRKEATLQSEPITISAQIKRPDSTITVYTGSGDSPADDLTQVKPAGFPGT